ncbi:MAG TPA: hypothetical protein VFR64_20845 [Methylomirabilota bacterium]|nr:hypothetical protein [Methylomirabilota bacterium]
MSEIGTLAHGSVAPRALALRHPERLACAMAAGRRAHPGLRQRRTRFDGPHERRASPPQAGKGARVSYLVREGAAKGVFEKVEEELVHNVFEFADAIVQEIMLLRIPWVRLT